MLGFDESRIESKIKQSLGVQHLRAQIAAKEAEIAQVHAALHDLPASVLDGLTKPHDDALEALLQREQQLVAQARATAIGELKAERVRSLQIEAVPLLERAAKLLETVRADLRKVAAIERDARANGGQLMTESFDESSIAFFIPKLKRGPRDLWNLTR